MSRFFEILFARPKATSMGSPNADKQSNYLCRKQLPNLHSLLTPLKPHTLSPHKVMDGIFNSDYTFFKFRKYCSSL